ncbi:hypothetical protein MMC27_006488 [Xylographa pallens]|nr:hypothetical protein [Xylographa pallens]
METLPHTAGDGEVQNTILQLANTPFDKKWVILEPIIKRLYVDEDRELPEVIEIMRTRYGFQAENAQYKYHVNKKWKFRKNISTPKKEALVKIRQTRAALGKATTFRSQQQDRNIDEKKLRRHLKDSMRRGDALKYNRQRGAEELSMLSGSSFLLANSIFLNWNMPYGTMRAFIARNPAPSPMSISTPSDIVVATPQPLDALSPANAPSPLTQLHNMKETMDRARMFVEGRFGPLVKSMRQEEREVMSRWMYQFWSYGFKSAKCWGRGPREWTAEMLDIGNFQTTSPLLNVRISTQSIDAVTSPNVMNILQAPSLLCHWSIHYDQVMPYEACRSRSRSPELDPDPFDETSWRPWPIMEQAKPYQERLLDSLANNHFSNISAANLPVAVPQIIKASRDSNEKLPEEALGFSIMARNSALLKSLLFRLSELEDQASADNFRKLNPLHLATTYLDGARSCCSIINELLYASADFNIDLNFRIASVNNLGHTVFDNLMINILKSHTSVTPGFVDDSLREETGFPAEDVDICGRWDADSDCIRSLYSRGIARIPLAWKHKFCNTSIQALTHSINMLHDYAVDSGQDSICEVPSGLFLKRCVSCGLKLQSTSLHTLVIVAFTLAKFGTKDEDLFGIVVILLCMLELDADPLITAELSPSMLFPDEDFDMINVPGCDHQELSAAQLAESVPLSYIRQWSNLAKTGWNIFCLVLGRSEKQWKAWDPPWNAITECDHKSFFGSDYSLRILCSAVQTEALTYRRLKEGDPWMSPNFDMYALLNGLRQGNEVCVNLVKDDMIEVCECGVFKHRSQGGMAPTRAEQITKFHFSNLEDWSRTTYIEGSYYSSFIKDRDNLHEEIDHHKNDQLQKQKDGKGHWKGELASQSEAALKADREEVEASDETISKLQKETEQYAQKTHEDAK